MKRIALSLATAVLLCGCVMPPKDAPREAPVPAESLDLEGAAMAPVPDGWWRGFGDPQLDRLVDDALAHSPTLAEALARLRLAQAQTDAAAALRDPRPAIQGEEDRQRLSATDLFPPPIGGSTFWRGNLSFAFDWDLDFWGRQADLVAQAHAQTQAAALDVDAARLLLAGALAQAYLDLDRNYALADLATRAEAQRAHIVDITSKRVDAGLDTRAELRLAEGAVPQARVERTQAQAAVELAVHRLAALTGAGAGAYPAIGRPQLDLDTTLPLPSQLPGNLLARRPDIAAARLRIAAADAGHRAAQAAFYPDLELHGLAGLASVGLSDLFRAASFQYSIGPSLRLPVFDAQRLKANSRAAVADIDVAIASYNGTVVQALQQAADQLSQIDALGRERKDQQLSLDAAEDAYRLAEERYRAGLASYLSVLNAETQVLAARRARIDLAAAQAVARVTLLLALGGSFDPGPAPQISKIDSPSP